VGKMGVSIYCIALLFGFGLGWTGVGDVVEGFLVVCWVGVVVVVVVWVVEFEWETCPP
jgi:hypothetical protein